jgi:anhydro-N-acetylmuramic acid kinase
MRKKEVFQVIGCMSGTSADGIDLALLETDGKEHVRTLAAAEFPYTKEEKQAIKAAFGLEDKSNAQVQKATDIITQAHIKALKETGWEADMIGFHGQTIFHAPDRHVTVQIGDAQAIAIELNIPVVYDMRKNDVQNGGQGAPLLPLYHRARLADMGEPVVILNIGGVSNITYVDGDTILAFDTGTGSAMIDDWISKHTAQAFDKDGEIAASGHADAILLDRWLAHPYFDKVPPKSLDRNDFSKFSVEGLSLENGAATLMAFTALSIAKAQDHFPHKAHKYFVTGGGRKNKAMMALLAIHCEAVFLPVEELGWNGDSLEAEGFAYLAVRSHLGLPLTLPTTTGCKEPLTGGQTALP